MLLPPQDLPGLHVLKKSLKGLCGSLSSSCPLCCWGGCWLGPAGVGACRGGVLSCKGGDNRKREERQHIYTLYCNHLCACLSPPTGLWPPRSSGLDFLFSASQEPSPGPGSKQAAWLNGITVRWMDGYVVSFWFWRKPNCPIVTSLPHFQLDSNSFYPFHNGMGMNP